MGCGCNKKSTRHVDSKKDYHDRYAFLTPAQLAAKTAKEATRQKKENK